MKGRIYKGKQHRYYIVIEGEEPVSTVFSRSCYQIENFSLKFLKAQEHLDLNDWKCQFEIVKKYAQSFAKVSAICPPNEELQEDRNLKRVLPRISDNSIAVVGTFCETCRQAFCICEQYEKGALPIAESPTNKVAPDFNANLQINRLLSGTITSAELDFFTSKKENNSLAELITPTHREKYFHWVYEKDLYTSEKASENLYTPDCIRTYTGKYINVFEPTLEMIDIVDIAHALSHVPRFGGHTANFYSVAQHSIAVSMKLPPEQQLAGLLHDATEAYLCDMPSPIKNRMPEYKKIEDKLMVAIARKFGITYPFMQVLKDADKAMLETEWNCIVLNREPFEFKHLSPTEAKKQFLELFEFLTTK